MAQGRHMHKRVFKDCMWSIKPKEFIIWTFTEKVCQTGHTSSPDSHQLSWILSVVSSWRIYHSMPLCCGTLYDICHKCLLSYFCLANTCSFFNFHSPPPGSLLWITAPCISTKQSSWSFPGYSHNLFRLSPTLWLTLNYFSYIDHPFWLLYMPNNI